MPCNIARAIARWFISRIVQLGLIEDETLNVAFFDGQANQTTSTHTADADGYRSHNEQLPPSARSWWGEIGCQMLSFLVQKNHCWNVKNGVPMTAGNYIRAFGCITIVLAAPWVIHWWALAFYAAAIAPFAIIEAISRKGKTP